MTQWPVILENVLQALTAGLLVGSVYALMCVGLGFIFGVMRVINFAQGEFLMLGHVRHAATRTPGSDSAAFLGPYVGPIVAAALAGVLLFIVGILLHRYLLARVTGFRVVGSEGEGHYAQLILTLGLSLILSNGGLILFGSTPENIRTPLSATAWELGPFVGDHVSIFLNKARSVAFAGLDRGGARALFVRHPLAARQNAARRGRQSRGGDLHGDRRRPRASHRVRPRRAAITAVAGGLVATYYPFQPYVGLEFVIIMYAGVVLGGMGSIVGAFWGGMTIGLVQQLSTLVLPVQLQNAAIFVVFLLIVLVRPQGLFGRNVERA